mgnify:CR=1 FL=1
MFFKPFYCIGTCGHSLLALGLDLVHGSFHQFAGHALASEGLVHKCMVDIHGILIYVRECDFSNGPAAAVQQGNPLLGLDVEVRTVATVIADWTGVPLSSLMKDEQTELLSLEESLGKRVVGQEAALSAIARRLRAAKTGLTPENGLVIGDSLSTDIQGANNAGLPCCWYNPAGKARPEDLRIDYEIRDLRELLDIV